ncbi:MAG: DNA-3-methyladenine glycosylase I, partial [Rhodospirillales bacterium]|nr:DNA-3-methyladenine glycosylase I [Rhodospirillales bacterium]
MTWYCDAAPGHPYHGPYHDTEYGYPQSDEAVLFERLSLEIFQAGLSWLIVLKKRPALVTAFAGFAVDRVAAFKPEDVHRLMADATIIRNRRKIEAVIENARRLQAMRASHGSFTAWLAAHHPRDKEAWTKLFRATFLFTGGEVVNEFL